MEIDNKSKLSNQELISLYGIFHDMQKRCTDEICKYLSTYISTNILILAGGILIFEHIDSLIFKSLFLLLCGLLVIIISVTLMKSTERTYQNQLEYISQTAQLEDLLNLDCVKMYGGRTYFKGEGLIIKRHLKSRLESYDDDAINTKKAFVDSKKNKGQRKYIVALSWVFIAFGIIVALSPIVSILFNLEMS